LFEINFETALHVFAKIQWNKQHFALQYRDLRLSVRTVRPVLPTHRGAIHSNSLLTGTGGRTGDMSFAAAGPRL